ncbi:anti-sigma factor [Arthrobacter sp. I2-34]|uniref:Regulator of SigK n=1 Tax=Arthrobacter hankyongi TaxID=2904801 RepID=A0ABS9L2G3_9MICC|nr:anti-sigma factor [Arthrobacter hankyongi]MCG2620851.1 anti-sigma factor [Arthrobacter hankyongi]
MDEQLHLLTGAYALNALDESERAAFERHALAAEDTREEVRGLSETAALLAYGTPAAVPPPELKSKVMASIRNTRQLPGDAVVTDLAARHNAPGRGGAAAGPGRGPSDRAGTGPGRGRSTTAARWLGAAAAVLLVAAGVLGGWAVSLAGEQQRTEQQMQALAAEHAEVMALLMAPDSKVIPGRMPDGAVVTVAMSARAGKGAVITQNLPSLAEGQAYELWLMSDGSAKPAGIIHPDKAGRTSMTMLPDVAGATHLGITIEPVGGSPQPTSAPVMMQKL